MSATSKEFVEAKEKEFMSLLLKAIDEENYSKRALLLWDAKQIYFEIMLLMEYRITFKAAVNHVLYGT